MPLRSTGTGREPSRRPVTQQTVALVGKMVNLLLFCLLTTGSSREL